MGKLSKTTLWLRLGSTAADSYYTLCNGNRNSDPNANTTPQCFFVKVVMIYMRVCRKTGSV